MNIPFESGRVNRQSVLPFFKNNVIDKLRELWKPEPGDVVYNGTAEVSLSKEAIEADEFDKTKFLPLLSLNKASDIISKMGYEPHDIKIQNYICMEDLIAKRMMTAIKTKYLLF